MLHRARASADPGSWAKVPGTKCSRSTPGASTYPNLTAALAACVSNKGCDAVADAGCDGAPYSLCLGVSTATGACTWKRAPIAGVLVENFYQANYCWPEHMANGSQRIYNCDSPRK